MTQSEKPRPLGVGLDPYQDESLIGFIFRAARHRPEYQSARDLALLNGMVLSNRPPPQKLDRLAAAIGTDPSLLAALCYGSPDLPFCLFRGLALPPGSLPRSPEDKRSVCPGCLAENAYHRAVWDFSFISACPVHLTELLSHCVTCGKALRWRGKSILRCRCLRSADLSAVIANPVSAMDIRGTEVVHGLLRDPRFASQAAWARTLPALQDMPDNMIIEFLYRIGLESVGGRGLHIFSTHYLGKFAMKSHDALSRGLQAAEAWPSGFYRILDAMRQRTPGDAETTLRKYIGPIERWLAKLDPGHGRCLKAALVDYRAWNMQASVLRA